MDSKSAWCSTSIFYFSLAMASCKVSIVFSFSYRIKSRVNFCDSSIDSKSFLFLDFKSSIYFWESSSNFFNLYLSCVNSFSKRSISSSFFFFMKASFSCYSSLMGLLKRPKPKLPPPILFSPSKPKPSPRPKPPPFA